jgi:hypothetical protein
MQGVVVTLLLVAVRSAMTDSVAPTDGIANPIGDGSCRPPLRFHRVIVLPLKRVRRLCFWGAGCRTGGRHGDVGRQKRDSDGC